MSLPWLKITPIQDITTFYCRLSVPSISGGSLWPRSLHLNEFTVCCSYSFPCMTLTDSSWTLIKLKLQKHVWSTMESELIRLSMHDQISSICQASFLELRRISSIRRYLSRDATARLATSMITSRLDYCNSALSGLPAEQLFWLLRVQSSAVWLVLNKKKRVNDEEEQEKARPHYTSAERTSLATSESSDVSTRCLFWLNVIWPVAFSVSFLCSLYLPNVT